MKRYQIYRLKRSCCFFSEKKKRGPKKVSTFLLEYCLIGIHLNRSSKYGLQLVRSFIAPNGRLQEVFNRNKVTSKQLLGLTVARGSKDDLFQWADKTAQSFERSILSHQLERDIKSFKDCQSELEKLRARISKKSNAIVKSVNERNSE